MKKIDFIRQCGQSAALRSGARRLITASTVNRGVWAQGPFRGAPALDILRHAHTASLA